MVPSLLVLGYTVHVVILAVEIQWWWETSCTVQTRRRVLQIIFHTVIATTRHLKKSPVVLLPGYVVCEMHALVVNLQQLIWPAMSLWWLWQLTSHNNCPYQVCWVTIIMAACKVIWHHFKGGAWGWSTPNFWHVYNMLPQTYSESFSTMCSKS